MRRKNDTFDAREAAAHLRISDHTIRRLAREGKIPAFKVGGSWRFRRSSLDRWADSQYIRRQRKSILVVDDEEPVRELLREVLQGQGFNVTTAAGGAEALELMERDLPDLVILNLKMPGMDGPTTLREIRSRHKFLPVVILTGYPDSELMARALQYSPITLLAKPAMKEQIVEAVRCAVAQEKSRSASL